MRERRDEAEPSAGFRNAHIARGAARSIVNVVELIAVAKARAYERERQILVETAFADLAERHHLDQRQIHAAPMRPFDQARKLVVIHVFEGNHVDLDF